MDRIALRTIIDGMNELQKECRKNFECSTCFFCADERSEYFCQIMSYIENDFENVGKYLSLQYIK